MSTILSVKLEQEGSVTLEVSGANAGTLMPPEMVAAEDAILEQAPEDAVVTSAGVETPMGVALQLGNLESSALVPTSLVGPANTVCFWEGLAYTSFASSYVPSEPGGSRCVVVFLYIFLMGISMTDFSL